jgi:hypothetical protein
MKKLWFAIILAALGIPCCAKAASVGLAGPPLTADFRVTSGVTVSCDGLFQAVAGTPVTFEATAVGSAISYAWTFSDGSPATGQIVSHSFSSAGIATVTLTVEDTATDHLVSSSLHLRVAGSGPVELNAITIVGAGHTDAWDTELVIANPFPVELDVLVGRIPRPCPTTCPPPVPRIIALPADGQLTLLASDFMPPEVSFLFVTPTLENAPGLPVVRARAFAVNEPSRAMELPVISFAEWANRSGQTLVFPGAEKSADSYSNLSIAELSEGSTAGYRVDAYDAAGRKVASFEGALQPGDFGVIVDVLKQMGVSSFAGQLRLTRTCGDGVLAGALATLNSDGSFAVSGGFNP